MRSLKNQSRKIDEVIIGDDMSTDNTVSLVRDFIKENHLENWKLIENKENKGWKVNFVDSFRLATGDIIFPCDQDDIWHLDKIEKMSSVMENNDEILLLASEVTPFCEEIGKNSKLSNKKDNTTIYRASFKKNFFYVRRPGCVYCFKNKMLRYFDNYWDKDYAHDAFLWRTAAMMDGLFFLNESTIDYRRHGGTATGREKKTIQRKIKNMKYDRYVLEVANEFILKEKVSNKDEKIKVINHYMQWCDKRIELLVSRKPYKWFLLIQYRDCFWSYKTMLADLLMVLNIIS